jgi:FlaA1/EpsC-like NDP-sugar epimerase
MNVDNTRTWLRTAALRIRSVPELISNVVLNWKRRGRPREIAIGSTKDTFKGRTAIVTGANAGIGRDLSLALASRGAHVIMACRSLERGHAAMQSMNKQMMTQRHNDTTFETGGDGP